MKIFFSLLIAVLLSTLSFAQTQTQHHEQKPEDPFRLQKLGEPIYALYGRGGNIGFYIGPDAVLVIDSQYRDLAPGIVQKIKSVTDKPIQYLVNTHHHPDHVGGNDFFKQFALILAHDNVRKRVLESPKSILEEYPEALEEAKKAGNADRIRWIEEQIEWAKKVKVEEIAAPFLTFDSEFRLHMGGETIHIWHTPPAHTDGDGVAYFEKSRVLHMGDLFFHKVIPFIDVKSGGSAQGYITAVDKVISRIPPDATIIPGHGEVTNLDGLKTFRKYLQDLNEAAAKAKAAGKSKEDFVKEIDFPAYKEWRGYEDRFKENAEAAYDEAR
ncbi:MBL fold metallo-hydrolase [bacterium]|nr:MBL fold metallo-hydrolase [bacterium]